MEGFLGEIKWFGGTYAPAYWQFCNGQILSTAEYASLFAVIGNRYGGDGINNFALPNLQCRVPIGAGQGMGLSPRTIADQSGNETEQINLNQMGAHSHQISNLVNTTSNLTANGTAAIMCQGGTGNTNTVKDNFFAGTARGTNSYSTTTSDSDVMNTNAASINANIGGDVNVNVQSQCSLVGGNGQHNNMQPWLCLNFIICVEGQYPPKP
ncbi:MAG: phage tail protein [Bacteroidales bacterium]